MGVDLCVLYCLKRLSVDRLAFQCYNKVLMAKAAKKTRKKRTVKSTSKVAKVKSKKAFRTYKDAIKYLFARTDYEKQTTLRYNVTTFNLDRMKKLLSLLGNPHKKNPYSSYSRHKRKGLNSHDAGQDA
ncbi:hypothetical protein ES703_46731 [subsurface metagenome]